MLDESLKKRLKICNKQLLPIERDEDQLFTNTFGDTEHKKITLGVQQLYIIGNIYNL